MIPQFALILSFSGLTLLQRVASGWEVVGDVALDSPDMSGELAALRTRAMVRADCDIGDFTTKLLLPDEQIRYMTLPAEHCTEEAVRKALAGATPYHVDDLVFDYDTDAAGTHVAAVARETLDEAEAFAIEHGFAPVSFVASPRDGRFDREVFFGMTAGAEGLLPAGMVLTADDKPLAIYRTEDDASPTFITRRAGDDTAEPANADPEAEPEEAPTPAPGAEPDIQDTPPAPAAPETDTQPATDPAKADAPAAKLAPTKPVPPTPQKPDTEGPVFRSAHHPKLQAPAKPKAPAAAKDAAPAKAPNAPQGGPAAAPAGSGADRLAKAIAAKAAEAKGAGLELDGTGALKPGAAEFTTFQGAQQRGNRNLWMALAALLLLLVAGAGVWALTSDGISRLFGRDSAALAPPAAPAPETAPEAAPEATTDTLPADPAPTEPELAAPEATPPEPTPEPETTSEAPVDPVILSPEDARRIYAATGVWQRAPRAQPLGDDSGAVPAAPQSEPAAPTPVGPAALATGEASLFSAPPEAPPLPPASDAVFDLDEQGLVRPTPQGALSPVGVPVFAGLPDKTPPPRSTDIASEAPLWSGIVRRQDLVRPKTRPDGFAPVIPEAPETPTAAPATDAPTTAAPATADQDAAVTPPPQPPASSPANTAARLAFMGDIRPMARPGSETEAPQQTAAAAPAPLPTTPPSVATVEQALANAAAPAASPPARSPSLALAQPAIAFAPTPPAVMPKLRPSGLVPDQQQQAVAVALAQVAPASPYAVLQSMRPKTRPGNFARVVAAATPRAQAQVAPRTVAPTGRSNNTVAARATEENAINLNRMNLIGVYGARSNRRALVRLSNGRFVKVGVGDRLDGGRVSSIGADDLRYSKGGRTVRLRIPSG